MPQGYTPYGKGAPRCYQPRRARCRRRLTDEEQWVYHTSQMPRLDRSDVAESTPDREGYCYILTHVAMPGLAKIGATRKHPIRRSTELSMGTGVPGAFTVSYYCAVPDAFAVEKATHEAFTDVRVDEGREFFTCTIDEAVSFIRHFVCERFGEGLPKEGGEWIENGGGGTMDLGVPTPMAEMFATFPDDYSPRMLTPNEIAWCRRIAAGNG